MPHSQVMGQLFGRSGVDVISEHWEEELTCGDMPELESDAAFRILQARPRELYKSTLYTDSMTLVVAMERGVRQILR